jgi:hypothetical protein
MSKFPVMLTGKFPGMLEFVVHFTPNCNWPVPVPVVVLIEAGQPLVVLPEFAATAKVPVLK